MSDAEYDLVVIGSGPGGYIAALRASQLSMRTALVERDRLGGICLNWGCIPTKALLKNAEVYRQFQRAADWGVSCDNLHFDFEKIVKRSRDVVSRLGKGVEFLLKKGKVTVVSGTARLGDSNTVIVRAPDGTERSLTTKRVCVATGARPRALPGITFDKTRILSYHEALALKSVPERFLMIGGGPIGLEFAFIYNTFGSKVTVVEMMPQILPQEDQEVATELARQLTRQGIKILTGARVTGAVVSDSGVSVSITQEDKTSTLAGDLALVATGVQANSENLGLEQVGVTIERGFIKVDDRCRTSVPGIWAIGDVTGPPMLAHVASAQAVLAVEEMAGLEVHPIDPDRIPSCTYTEPGVASVGLTEAKARERCAVKVGRFHFRALGKAVAIGERDGFVKLVFDETTRKLLGAHIVGPGAPEMIGELSIAKTLAATSLDIHRTVHAHPTLSEAAMEAAADADGVCVHA